MKIAIEGCCHGELDQIYSTLEGIERRSQTKIDLLIICGDFQAIRNTFDLHSMAVPDKYKQMCTFWKYYAGIKKAPILTIFVGGNHEASNYLSELPYGGWVAENIYYMGYANVLNFGGLRIAGLSGIYNSEDFHKGHFEIPPYNNSTKRSVYHVRNLEVFRLSQLKRPVDIMITHDWPTGVYHHGDVKELLRIKPYFREEIELNTLGSPEGERLLKLLKPKHWFSAHLHVRFTCDYKHDDQSVTKFLSLDKCIPRRRFLEIIDIDMPSASGPELALDPEWLVILKKTDRLLSTEYYHRPIDEKQESVEVSEQEEKELSDDFDGCLTLPKNFKPTAPKHTDNNARSDHIYLNEQTTLLCEMLSIRDPVRVILEKRGNTGLVAESKTQLYNDLLDESD